MKPASPRLSVRLLLYALLLTAIFGPWLAWETDRNMVRRWIYPVKGHLAAWSTRCDPGTPPWVRALARDLAIRHGSPANQLVFVDAQGHQRGCVNGWQATPLFSLRLQHDTPLRLASLSKMVSFMGLVQAEAAGQAQWLDQPVVALLDLHPPFADARVADIRIRDLLRHSAGFDRMRSIDPMTEFDKRPWCPADVGQLGRARLDFAPGSRFAYGNLGYCLAAVAYEKHFGHSLWAALEEDLHLSAYGLDYLDRRDTPVRYNFMHQNMFEEKDLARLDWHSLRAPMGMTGPAQGVARFVAEHRQLLQFARAMRNDAIACDESRHASCFDGFLERFRADNTVRWGQRGYLYGMAASFVMDEAGNFVVWLGTGESRPLLAPGARIEQALLTATAHTANPQAGSARSGTSAQQ